MNGQQEPSTWIAVCQASALPDRAVAQATYDVPGQPATALVVAGTAPPACEAARIAVAPADVIWARLVPPATANRLRAGFLLQGGESTPARSSEIILLDDSDPVPSPRARDVREPREAPPVRAMWAWRPAHWRENATSLFALATAWSVGVIYISVPVAEDGTVADAERLREFLRDATGRGIEVWSVDGEPRAILPAERQPSCGARAPSAPSTHRERRALPACNSTSSRTSSPAIR